MWRNAEGGVFLPFDPSHAIETFWREEYAHTGRSRLAGATAGFARRAYYRAKPAIPRSLQLRFRRAFASVQQRSRFPGWPVETALHDLYAWLLSSASELAAAPVPYIAPWPEGFDWCLVLTHDVETAAGYSEIGRIAKAEEELGYRSSWNLVPERDYRVDDATVASLQDRGFEVGLHGLRHDGRDVLPDRSFERRLPVMKAYAERWGAVGFRAPATHRSWDRMPRLGADYDSSYGDTMPYEPQAGGSCTWFPFMNGDLVELPITLPQDHTLFELLGEKDERVWIEKADFLRDRGGMALVLTHPDYMIEGPVSESYSRVLQRYASDSTAWKPLPRGVSAWWRKRGASEIREAGEGWDIVGPATDGVVAFHE